MTLNNLNDLILRFEQRVISDAEKIVTRRGGDMCALIADRVINEGESAKGGAFTPYSTTQVPAFWFYGRSRNAGADTRVRSVGRRKKTLSYREFRVLNTLPVARKNFSFTNQMWRHFGVSKADRAGLVVRLSYGGLNALAADKIKWLSDQERQSIIAPNQKELDALYKGITEDVRRLLV